MNEKKNDRKFGSRRTEKFFRLLITNYILCILKILPTARLKLLFVSVIETDISFLSHKITQLHVVAR